jgi:predicted dehydrogenase
MGKIRIGMLGAGGISRAHLAGWQQCPELAEIVAVADPRREAAEALAAAAGGAAVYHDFESLLAEAAVDAVDIVLPHDLHAPAAIAAAAAGRHVLVEKVMACTLAECDAMIAAAESAGVKLMVCHDHRYHSVCAKIKELLDAGALGELQCLRFDHNQDVNMAGSWAFSKARLGGGAIASCLVHQFDLMRWYAGDVAQVAALTRVLPDRLEGESIAVVPLRFRNGALGDAVINWNLRGQGYDHGGRLGTGAMWYELIWLAGSEGNLHNLGGLHLLRHGGGGYERIEVEVVPGHIGAMRHFAECIRDDRQPLTDGRAGRAALEIAVAAYRSEETGRVVDLPSSGI